MLGVHHSKDLDGLCSGAIIKEKYPDATMIGWDYGQPYPLIDGTEEVIMTDISFPIPEMIRITKLLGDNLTIIDHHQRFINEFTEALIEIDEEPICILDSSKSACELTFEYLFPDKPTPEWITLLGDYDTWRSSKLSNWKEKIVPFQYAMRSIISTIDDFSLPIGTVPEVIEKGKYITKYVEETDSYTCKHYSFETTFKGYRAICLNVPGISSDTFKSIYDERKHDIIIGFCYTGKFWKVSLRSIKAIDVSLLASQYTGGGGHFHAAGFEVQDIDEIIKK